MFKNKRKSILFHNPDYHCTFFYQEELIKSGWRADIFASDYYPEKLLFDSNKVKRSYKITKLHGIDYTIWLMANFFKYKYIVFYGRPVDYVSLVKKSLGRMRIEPILSIMKFFWTKIIFLQTGCNDEFTRKDFLKFDNGNVCGNCGFFDRCDDDKNTKKSENYLSFRLNDSFSFINNMVTI